MKIFSWMQNRLNGRQQNTSLQVTDQKVKDIMVWPDGLLSIGTFGINNLKDPRKCHLDDDEDDDDISPTDEQLLKEFLSLRKGSSLPPENIREIICCLGEGNESSGDSSSLNKSLSKDKTKKSIRKRALNFLLKKTFLGSANSILNHISRDPLDLKLEKSMMEKILRSILHNQVHPQGSNPKTRKCLDKKHFTPNECQETREDEECQKIHITRDECQETREDEDKERQKKHITRDECQETSEDEDECQETLEDDDEECPETVENEHQKVEVSKWVVTDSEYIVLEI